VQPVSYNVVPGDLTAQIMGGFTAAGTMAFSLANILLPEVYLLQLFAVALLMQMSGRKPAVQQLEPGQRGGHQLVSFCHHVRP
jgi:hypothetical protein